LRAPALAPRLRLRLRPRQPPTRAGGGARDRVARARAAEPQSQETILIIFSRVCIWFAIGVFLTLKISEGRGAPPVVLAPGLCRSGSALALALAPPATLKKRSQGSATRLIATLLPPSKPLKSDRRSLGGARAREEGGRRSPRPRSESQSGRAPEPEN
jgi:hypothetical protein